MTATLTYAGCTYGVAGSYEHLCAMTYGDCLYGSPGGVFHNLCGIADVAAVPSHSPLRMSPIRLAPRLPDDDALVALILALT